MSNQCERVLTYMQLFDFITQKEAINDLGVWRLASRISDLKKEGYAIKKEMAAVLNRYGEVCHIARYSLDVEKK